MLHINKLFLMIFLTFLIDSFQKISIGIVFNFLDSNGGIDKLVVMQSNELVKNSNFLINLIYYRNISIVNNINPEVHKIKLPILNAENYEKALKDNKIDVIICHMSNIKYLEIANKLKCKTIYIQHYNSLYDMINAKNRHQLLNLNKYTDVFVTPIEDHRILFELENFKYQVFIPHFLLNELNINKISKLDNKNILYVAILYPLKNQLLAIEAMSEVIKEIPDAKLYLVGRKDKLDYFNKLTAKISELNLSNNVILAGEFSDLEQIYRNSSVYLHVSKSESFGLVIAEAKSYGLPTVVVNLDYLCLSKKGSGTVNIDNYSKDEIAKALIEILKNDTLRKQLGKESFQQMKEINNDIIRNKWIKLIESLYKGDKDMINYIHKYDNYNKPLALDRVKNYIIKQAFFKFYSNYLELFNSSKYFYLYDRFFNNNSNSNSNNHSFEKIKKIFLIEILNIILFIFIYFCLNKRKKQYTEIK